MEKSIIEKVEEERERKKREEIERAKKAREEALSFIAKVAASLSTQKLEFIPRIAYFGGRKVKVEIDEEKISLVGKMKRLLSPFHLIRCEYITAPLSDRIFEDVKKERAKVKCYVGSFLEKEREIAQSFSHDNLAVLAYDVETRTLYYNPSDERASYIAELLKPGKIPSLEEILGEIAKEQGTFTLKNIVEATKLPENEAKKLLRDQISRGRIIKISEEEYSLHELSQGAGKNIQT